MTTIAFSNNENNFYITKKLESIYDTLAALTRKIKKIVSRIIKFFVRNIKTIIHSIIIIIKTIYHSVNNIYLFYIKHFKNR